MKYDSGVQNDYRFSWIAQNDLHVYFHREDSPVLEANLQHLTCWKKTSENIDNLTEKIHFRLFLRCIFRPEVASHVISGAHVREVDIDVPLKFGDSIYSSNGSRRSNRSRDIRLSHSDDAGVRRSSHQGKTPT